uniref:Uncharacterized protein n=2 Tax=Oryza TaxID=4527 RepID=A0A0D3F1Z6_9ORYZ
MADCKGHSQEANPIKASTMEVEAFMAKQENHNHRFEIHHQSPQGRAPTLAGLLIGKLKNGRRNLLLLVDLKDYMLQMLKTKASVLSPTVAG